MLIEDRNKSVTIKNDSSMIVPIFHVNPEIRKFQSFSAFFCTLIQDKPYPTTIGLNLDHDESEKDICVSLNAVDADNRIKKLLQAEELIKVN